MQKAIRGILVVVAAFGAAAVGYYAYQNPEARAVDESGHLPQMEQTTAFDAHLFAFLDAHPPGAR